MKTQMTDTCLFFCDIRLTVFYKIWGTYRMATREDPEEWPDITIEKICIGDDDQDVMELLLPHYTSIHELLTEQIYEEL
jgi:hypothetical protein